MNGPLKNEKSRQILLKSRNLAQPTIGSRILRFCVCRSHICFSIKSLNFSVSVSDFKMPVSASRRVSDLPFATPTLMMASAQVVETSVNTNNSPSQDYTTNPDDHSNHNIDSPGFKPFTVIPSGNYRKISSPRERLRACHTRLCGFGSGSRDSYSRIFWV